MIRHPDLLSALVLVLATFRLARLAGWDEITVTLRGRLTGIPDSQYDSAAKFIEGTKAGGSSPWDPDSPHAEALLHLGITERRYYLAKLVRCPWCFGFWASCAVWILWSAEPRVTIWLAVPFALSAAVGLVAKRLDP